MPTPTKKRYREEKNSLEGQIVRLAESGQLDGAAKRAVRIQRKRGIPYTQKRGNQIIKFHPDGREEVLGEIKPTPYVLPSGVVVVQSRK